MKTFALVVVVMVAFAANSVLNRAAVGGGWIDPLGFGTVRLWAGAVVLLALAYGLRRRTPLLGPVRLAGVAGLVLYIYGFSLAYSDLDAGLGALILFGTVQITMFVGSLIGGERPPVLRWLGAAVAFGGLAWLLWPGAGVSIVLGAGAAMVVAGFGWGVYSLAGRKAEDALISTAANFVLAAPFGLVIGWLPGVPTSGVAVTGRGLALAVVSGAVTSGLGYALWYAVLPQLKGSVAAVAQLTVPVIAMAGGMLVLAEPLTAEFAVAAAVVLGGVGLSVLRR
ncbi:DMT family transporter [Tropicibacter naphthalenivorans]|uniref:DMT family transporter n=1 Tax=Tropicibacter naphthalenivorans TaxID=441103 RepID=UPI00071C865E|nr:DMT family transporter [Tropicibacter naphthalenivorans]